MNMRPVPWPCRMLVLFSWNHFVRKFVNIPKIYEIFLVCSQNEFLKYLLTDKRINFWSSFPWRHSVSSSCIQDRKTGGKPRGEAKNLSPLDETFVVCSMCEPQSSEPVETKAWPTLTLLCINTCSSKSPQAQTEGKVEEKNQCSAAACWYLQIRSKLAWMASRESNTLNEVGDKRPTTSQTLRDETVKATTQRPGGSWGGVVV